VDCDVLCAVDELERRHGRNADLAIELEEITWWAW